MSQVVGYEAAQPLRFGLGAKRSDPWMRRQDSGGGAAVPPPVQSGTMAAKKGLSETEKRTRMSEIFTSVTLQSREI